MTRQYAANRIRELRKEIGLTQEDIAEGLGGSTTKGTVAKLEKGAMALSLDYIKGIAKVLGVDPAEIIAPVERSARDVPLIGAVAAGNWREAIEDARERDERLFKRFAAALAIAVACTLVFAMVRGDLLRYAPGAQDVDAESGGPLP